MRESTQMETREPSTIAEAMVEILPPDMAEGLREDAVARRVVSMQVARHALWHLGDNENWAVQPGRFEQLLFQLIDTADDVNKERLEKLFPEHVVALRDGRKHWGLEWLRKVASEVGA